jgi:SAM-dependent methyltransferase/glycosyltransferase involved in cell wall biosynthesis
VRTVDGDEGLIEELATACRFELALIATWYTAERYIPAIRRSSPRTRVIVDSVDLHFLRATRGAFLDGGLGPTALGEGEGAMFVRELNTYSWADAVLTVSEKEANAIDDLLARQSHAIMIPDCEEGDRSLLTFEERAGILFIGNFAHPPNVGAAEFLCEEIAPRIDPAILERHPINIVGNALNDSIRALCERRVSINAVGWVPSVQPYLSSARVSVVPLLYGAGTKRKLIQALRAGTPTVSTNIGVEGLGLTPGSEVLVADDPLTFATSVERLIEDEELWSRLADSGRNLIEREHSRATAHARFRAAVAEVLNREPNGSAPRVPATATRERAPLPDPPRRSRVSRSQPDPPILPRPIFIVGSPRSGTSALTWALGQHPNILPIEESDWLSKLGADLAFSYDLATRRGDRSAFAAMGVSRASLYSTIGRAVNELICSHRERYEERVTAPEAPEPPSPAHLIARSRDDAKARWIDGTPGYSHSIVALRRLFPGAVFIHLVRDVREVAQSLVHFHTVGGPPINWQQAYTEWLDHVKACVAAEQAYGSAVVLRIRHGDLVADPEAVVRRCLTFIGESYSSQCLEPLETRINSSRAPANEQSPAAEDITPELREEAECLSDRLLSEGSLSYSPALDKQTVLEREYSARVPVLEQFFAELAPDVLQNDGDESDEVRQQRIMRREWDERAKLNPMHYIASNKVVWDEEDFLSGGAADVEHYVESDLEVICGDQEAKSMRMLEIGCGIGRMTRSLAGIFGEVHGVDVAPTMVSLGQEKLADLANVHLYETSGSTLGMFADGFFDFAFSYIVFQNVPFRAAVISYFREVHRTLKPGGLFKFQVQGVAIERPNTWIGVGFGADEMQGHALEIGFEALREEGAGTQLYWHWWRRV